MDLVELIVNRISYSQSQNGAYALILEEIDGKRKLPIVIGGFEAQSIAVAMDKDIEPPRPLTHDLFKKIITNHGITINKVLIHKLKDGVFFSSIICKRGKKEEVFDARTSDAIALALRFDAKIYTYDKILDNAGIILQKESKGKKKKGKFDESFKGYSIKDLNKKISKAVKDENYELAAKLRDEINQRK